MYKYIVISLLLLATGCTTNQIKQGDSYLERKNEMLQNEGKITRKYKIYIYKKGTSQEQIDSVLSEFYKERTKTTDTIESTEETKTTTSTKTTGE